MTVLPTKSSIQIRPPAGDDDDDDYHYHTNIHCLIALNIEKEEKKNTSKHDDESQTP